MTIKLLIQAISKFIIGFLVLALILFVSAGTLGFWNAWVFLGILFVPMLIAGVVLIFRGNLEVEKREKWTKPRISRKFFVKFQFST